MVTVPSAGDEATIEFHVGTRGTAGTKKFYTFSVPKEELPELKGARSTEWGPVFRLCNENGAKAEVKTVKTTTGFAADLKAALLVFGPLAVLAAAAIAAIRKSREKKKVQKILEQDPGLRKKQPLDKE